MPREKDSVMSDYLSFFGFDCGSKQKENESKRMIFLLL